MLEAFLIGIFLALAGIVGLLRSALDGLPVLLAAGAILAASRIGLRR